MTTMGPSWHHPISTKTARLTLAGDELDFCLRSPRVGEDDLPTHLAARLNRLTRDARTSLSELGVTTLHLAFGLLRWYESSDSQVELRALDAPAGPARPPERSRSG
jgi:Protein of unknown function (DUF4011)